MKRLIVALLLTAVLSATIWALTAALTQGGGTTDSGPTGFSNSWDLTNSTSFPLTGPP